MAVGDTVELQGLLDRLHRGEAEAINDLLRAALKRLEKLAHKMFATEAKLRQWEETADLLQNALLRLTRALEQTRP
jgi:DNA-directed RNA polymerase specialized sigma24 family protein